MILNCTCSHEFQDETYGKGRRVMNPATEKGKKPNQYRCTVCSALKEKREKVLVPKPKK